MVYSLQSPYVLTQYLIVTLVVTLSATLIERGATHDEHANTHQMMWEHLHRNPVSPAVIAALQRTLCATAQA